MISRIILCVAMGGAGFTNMFPDTPQPLTAAQLQAKGKYKSVSDVCKGKRKSKAVKELCERWERRNA
jgi:hypothetical protein